MIREYAPIPLIPAAWILTFLTVVYPGVDPYWIKHMHLFMLVFLAFFALFSWNEMRDKVMKTWRNIIAAGFFFTLLGTAGFYLSQYQEILSFTTIIYWFVAPTHGFRVTSDNVDEYSDIYKYLGYLSVPATFIFALGYSTDMVNLMGAGFIMAAAVQLVSIVLASKMDQK
jgi:hypothetical protein